MKKEYCTHKYQVYNDSFHWPRIVATVPEYGSIFHMDYSENMSQMHKYEVQSAHFNKRNYSLHCTVEHIDSVIIESDNSSTQHKCAKAFNEFLQLAKKSNRNVVKYYGPSGHGKGLVDAMSAFGVKGPLQKEVITCNFQYSSSTNICSML